MLLMLIIIWIICGFLAYGMLKGSFKDYYRTRKSAGYDTSEEVMCCWIVGILGAVGLIGVIIVLLIDKDRFSFCLRMPKELKKGYGERFY